VEFVNKLKGEFDDCYEEVFELNKNNACIALRYILTINKFRPVKPTNIHFSSRLKEVKLKLRSRGEAAGVINRRKEKKEVLF
jgi:hypothetical protein